MALTQIKAIAATSRYRSATRLKEATMTHRSTQQHHEGLMARALDWLFVRGGARHAPAPLSDADLRYMASDLGITVADLIDVLPRAADHTLLMDRMMQARGLDPQAVRRMPAALVRDLEMTCTRCTAARRCRRDLEAGAAAVNCHDYCGNADTFDAILRGRVSA
jgi:hypothetical protein